MLMKQNFFLQLKSLLLLFVLSLCCTTAWAIDNCVIKYKATEDLSDKFKGIQGSATFSPSTFTPNTEITVSYSFLSDEFNSSSSSALYQCTALTSITLPEGVTKIDNSSFAGCSSLSEVVLPSSLVTLGAQVFYGCTSLSAITLNDGLKTIGSTTFYRCNLSSITIPSSVTKIHNSAFQNNSNLSTIICNGETPAELSANYYGQYDQFAGCKEGFCIIVPTGKESAYKTAWAAYASHIYDPADITWTLQTGNGALTSNGVIIPLTATAKSGDASLITSLADNANTTVEFWNVSSITKVCEGTLSANTEAGSYNITVSGDELTKLKACQGQTLTVKFAEGALKAYPAGASGSAAAMAITNTATFTVPADVTFSFSNTDYNHVDDSQLMTGFNLIVTAGTEAPTLDNDKKFLLSYGSDYVVVLDPTPTLVAGTTNQWKYTAKVKTDDSGYLRIYSNGSEYGDYNHKAVPMIANNSSFTLTVPAGAFTSGWSTNTTDVGVDGYELYPKAVFTFSTDGVIKDGSNYTFIVNVKATAPTAASDADKNPYLNYGDNHTQGWTVSDYTGTVGVACEFAGTYKITLDYSKLVTKSSYILTIPAGKFKAFFNENEKTYLSFTIAERPQWTTATTTDGYAVSIDEADGVATIVPTKNNLPLTILDASKIDLYYGGGSGVPASFMVVPGSSELKVIADFSAAKAPYYVQFRDGSVKAGNTVYMVADNNNADVARINVTANFTFVDPSVTDATATTKADVKADKTYNQLTYKRNYTGKTETLYVPFNITPTAENQILDNVYIWKLVNITVENGNPVFNFSKVENDATLYANKPYLIRKKDGTAGEYAMTLKNVTTQAPVSNSVKSSTTTDTYSFTGIVEDTNIIGSTGKVWYVKKSTGNLNNLTDGQNGTLAAWRWYMTTTSKNLNYAKFNLEGEFEDATGISQIENGELKIDNSAIYNLNGQRISKAQRGINIINGRKVFVK